ncbi:DUF7844 domain-containing protein [Lysobacter sp. A3-1-A15]|uniref:DUF7844 domain-containing protein n=1 Tax=Novilysobacter viscosus TaxID=3098602 RepID=UPI002ED8FE90
MSRVRLRAGTLAALALLAGLPTTAHAFELVGDHAALSPGRAQASQALLDDVGARLPPRWRDALVRPVTVRWAPLPGHVHGRVQLDVILLQQDLLEEWMQRPADPAAPTADDPGAARRALIHELAHLYDRENGRALSGDPRLLDLAGWQVRALGPGRIHDNPMRERSPDRYELTDPAEYVAVNLEHFLLDPSYACRRPALHRHFAGHFQLPTPDRECAPGVPFLDAGRAASPSAAPLLELDPARVYAIHYLLAESNQRVMSRWGHSMLRLVVCAPGRPPGPDCRLDLDHHRVLSFRAFVDDVELSSWRGLAGGYPSRLFVLPLAQVVEEYTGTELRGLQSIPLALDTDEIDQLLERAAQVHWSYDGDYYFVTNNCAVETFKLLHDAVPRLAASNLSSITPTGLLHRLQRAGAADMTVLQDHDTATRLGHYFPSQDTYYQAMLDTASARTPLPRYRVADWLALPPTQRAPWLEQADIRATAALLVLEQAALRRQELQARDALKQRISGRARNDSGAAMRAALEAGIELDAAFAHPAAMAPGGYGIPQHAGRHAVRERASAQAVRWREQDARLREAARDALPAPRRLALDATRANLDRLGWRLRMLHREAAGVDLRGTQ